VILPPTVDRSILAAIPDGDDGIAATLDLMVSMIREYKADREIVLLARSLTGHLSQKDFVGEAATIQEFVRDDIRYVRDVHGVETLQTPDMTLAIGSGDCDDKAVLAASLLAAIGHPTRIVAGAFNDGPFEHVWVETLVGRKWLGVETTEPVPFGWTPPRQTRRMVRHV